MFDSLFGLEKITVVACTGELLRRFKNNLGVPVHMPEYAEALTGKETGNKRVPCLGMYAI